MDVLKICTIAALGTLEGYGFVRTGIVAPQAFQDQMEFKSFIIMKLFFSAVGTSLLVQSALALVSPKKFDESRKYSKKSQGFARAIGGCFTLGCGMYICGSGPTMMPSQVSSGVKSALMIVGGAFTGGLLYGMAENVFTKVAKCGMEQTSLDKKAQVSYPTIAVPFGLALMGATVALEGIFPHANDIARIPSLTVTPYMLPIYAGMIIGLNQIPLRLMAGSGQGGSTSVMSIISTATGGVIAPSNKVSSLIGCSQISYVWIGTLLGGYYASTVPTFRAPDGFGALQTFLGGALMIFGARVADGCTCGHGITGMSELSVESIAAAMSIFAGGIATGVVANLLF